MRLCSREHPLVSFPSCTVQMHCRSDPYQLSQVFRFDPGECRRTIIGTFIRIPNPRTSENEELRMLSRSAKRGRERAIAKPTRPRTFSAKQRRSAIPGLPKLLCVYRTSEDKRRHKYRCSRCLTQGISLFEWREKVGRWKSCGKGGAIERVRRGA